MIKGLLGAAAMIALVTVGPGAAMAQVLVAPESDPYYYSGTADPDAGGPVVVDPGYDASPFVDGDDNLGDPGPESNCTTTDPLASCDRSQGGDKGPAGGNDS